MSQTIAAQAGCSTGRRIVVPDLPASHRAGCGAFNPACLRPLLLSTAGCAWMPAALGELKCTESYSPLWLVCSQRLQAQALNIWVTIQPTATTRAPLQILMEQATHTILTASTTDTANMAVHIAIGRQQSLRHRRPQTLRRRRKLPGAPEQQPL
jgi:hypothetical protein